VSTLQKGLPQSTLLCVSWTYDSVVEVYKRYYQLQDTALELFFADGDTFLFGFDSVAVGMA
jgi:hypothetical protein